MFGTGQKQIYLIGLRPYKAGNPAADQIFSQSIFPVKVTTRGDKEG
jgi:hypothetical protein